MAPPTGPPPQRRQSPGAAGPAPRRAPAERRGRGSPQSGIGAGGGSKSACSSATTSGPRGATWRATSSSTGGTPRVRMPHRRVDWAAMPPPTPFMEWLEASGIQFGFDTIAKLASYGRLPGRYFFGSNTSAKTSFLRANRGFDESMRPACEDVELGMRLEARGLRLAYRPGLARITSTRPTSPAPCGACAGPAARGPCSAPGSARPRKRRAAPAPQAPRRQRGADRGGSAAESRTSDCDARPGAFLCHEAHREGFWAIDARREGTVRIGATLARLARRNPRTRMPT